MSIHTEELIKTGLTRKYPSLDLAAQFQAFVDEEEYDSDLIKNDIIDPDCGEIRDHLLEKNSSLNKDEIDKTLKATVINPPNALDQQRYSPEIIEMNENEDENDDDDDDDDISEDLNNAEEHIINQPPSMLQLTTTSASNVCISSAVSSISQFTQYLFQFNKNDMERVKGLMEKYCASLLDDNNLIYLHMICYTIEKPFFSWIMDTFDRFKIDYNPNYDNINPLFFDKICPLFGKYLEELSVKNQMDFDRIIPDAMHKYNEHILKGFDFKPKYKISDNYYQFISNVFGINKVVKKLVNNKQIYPFQLDVWIIPNEIITNDYQTYEEKKQCADDVEEAVLGRDDYGESYYEQDEYENKHEKKENLKYVFDINNHNKIIDWIEDSFEQKEIIKIEKNMRYILMIDRRKEIIPYCLIHSHKDNINNNYCYFNESYFENSKNFIFVTEDEDKDDDWSLYENNRHIFGLSYHIINKHSIKIYWNIGNKKSRFKMSDLWNIWPMYFNDKLNDLHIKVLNDIKQLTNEVSDLPDHEFNAFYQCITSTITSTKTIVNTEENIEHKQPEINENENENENENIEQEYEEINENENKNENENENENIEHKQPEINESENENENENIEQEYEEINEKNINMQPDHSMSGMIEWLKHKEFVNKYSFHHKTFENAIREQWDDSDFEIEELGDELGDIDDSQILTTIRDDPNCNKSQLNDYIRELKNNLKQYADIDFVEHDINININIKEKEKEKEEEKYDDDDIDEKVQPINEYNDETFEDIGYKYGGGNNKKIFKKVYDKHFSFYCCNDCGGNHFARYIFCDIDPTQKLEILMNYFWSFDYELRKNLITLLTDYYDPKQSKNMHKLLSELNNPNVFIDNDNKWIKIFENVLNEENGHILLRLSQLTCVKKSNNLIKELRDNKISNVNINFDVNILPDFQKCINEIRNNLNKWHINLTNDEISVLYIMANDNKFNILQETHNINGKRRSCQWKCFHFNLISAVNKLKKHYDKFDIPNDLYSYAHGINAIQELNIYLNQITLWRSDQIKQNKKNSILHLKNLKRKGQQNILNNIQIIPIEWIVNKNGNNNLFLVLPFRITKLSQAFITKVHISETINQYTIPSKTHCKSIRIIAL